MAELISKNGNRVEFKVVVPAAEVGKARSAVWSDLSKGVRIPGFRAGKALRAVIEARVGKEYIEAQTLDRLLQVHYPKAARELELNLVDAQIDPEALGSGDFSFTVKGEVYPEVTLGDWKAFELSAKTPEITDEALEGTLSDLQERNARFEEVERPIEEADQVLLQEEGNNSYPVYLSAAAENVRTALLGKSKGDTVEIAVENEEAPVKVKVLEVKSKQLSELNDEFAASLNFDSLERLRTELRGELERRAEQEGETARREELLNHLVEGMTVDIPQVLIDRRRDAMMEEVSADLRRQGVQWKEYETFMRQQGKLDEFLETLRSNAEIRVRRDLALEQLGNELEVKISELEFNQTLTAIAQINGLQPQQFVNQVGEEGLRSYYVSMLRERALQQAIALLSGESTEEAAEETPEAKEDTKEESSADNAE